MDVEMDENAEGSGVNESSGSEGPSPPYQQPQSSTDGVQRSGAEGLLAMARQLLQEGKPSMALRAVLMAVKTEGGVNAVCQVLNRARELYLNKLQQANTTADELASLFARCAIAEVAPSPGPESPSPIQGGAATMPPPGSIDDTSILAESGRKQVVLDAFSDGSSFVCLQCGGLVSNLRKDEHFAYWCRR